MKHNYNDDDKTLRYLKQTILEKNHREKVKFFSFTFPPQKKKKKKNRKSSKKMGTFLIGRMEKKENHSVENKLKKKKEKIVSVTKICFKFYYFYYDDILLFRFVPVPLLCNTIQRKKKERERERASTGSEFISFFYSLKKIYNHTHTY